MKPTNNIEIQINDSYNKNNDNTPNILRDSMTLLNNSLKNSMTQSIMDFVKCCICFSSATEPLTCQNCGGFACRKCLEIYFGNKSTKKCPLCKGVIKLNQMKENQIIKEIEEILEKREDKKDKLKELELIIEQKKGERENQTNNIINLIDCILKYQEDLENYKQEYINFIGKFQKLIESTFYEFNKEIENLVNSLLKYKEKIDTSIQKYDNIYKDNINIDNIDNDNINVNDLIKSIINQILDLERKHFNDKGEKEVKKFFDNSIQIVPSINLYNIKDMKFNRNKFSKNII